MLIDELEPRFRQNLQFLPKFWEISFCDSRFLRRNSRQFLPLQFLRCRQFLPKLFFEVRSFCEIHPGRFSVEETGDTREMFHVISIDASPYTATV